MRIWQRKIDGKVHKIKGSIKCIDCDIIVVLNPGSFYYEDDILINHMVSGTFSFLKEHWKEI